MGPGPSRICCRWGSMSLHPLGPVGVAATAPEPKKGCHQQNCYNVVIKILQARVVEGREMWRYHIPEATRAGSSKPCLA